MRKKFYIACLSIYYAIGVAQSDSVKIPRFKISSFTFGYAFTNDQIVPVSQQTFMRMAPNNFYVNQNMNLYRLEGGNRSLNGSLSTLLGIRRYNKHTKSYFERRENRIGIRYTSSSLLYTSYGRNSHTHFDSVQIPGNSGNYYKNVFLDTNWTRSIEINRSALMLDFGTIFNSDPNHLLSAYIGYMGSAGASINTRLVASEFVFASITQFNSTLDNSFVTAKGEKTDLSNSFIGSAHAVSGLNLRFTKKRRRILKRLSLSIEGRAGFITEGLQGYGLYTRFNTGACMFLRVRI